MKSKLLVPHVADCRAVASVQVGARRSPWWLPPISPQHHLDKLGRKNAKGGWHRWVELRCNSTNCDARCIVLCDAIEELGPVPSGNP